LQRIAPWLQELPGGMAYLKRVVIEDCLGICKDLEDMMQRNMDGYKCEWREVVYDDELKKKFQQFVNTSETHDSEQIEYIDMRKQRHPNTYSPPDITGPALYRREEALPSWEWVSGGNASDYPRNGGLAVKHGRAEVAVFHVPGREAAEQWLATQNLSPCKQSRTISRGLVGEPPNGSVTLADPIYKNIFDLRTGLGLSNPALNLSTFNVKLDGGKVLVQLPPADELAKALEKQAMSAFEAKTDAFEPPARKIAGVPMKAAAALDW
jgi:nitrite reductase/ring-hydroxylating ferredoxin subunit